MKKRTNRGTSEIESCKSAESRVNPGACLKPTKPSVAEHPQDSEQDRPSTAVAELAPVPGSASLHHPSFFLPDLLLEVQKGIKWSQRAYASSKGVGEFKEQFIFRPLPAPQGT